MKQILINKSVAYAAKEATVGTVSGTISGINEIHLLATGAVAVFTESNVLITAAGVVAQTSDQKAFYIAVGNRQPLTDGGTDFSAGGNTYVSALIPRMLLDYRKKAYVAPVQLVKYIGYDGTTAGTALNLPFTTAVAADAARSNPLGSAFIKIINTTPGLRTLGYVYEQEILRYEYQIKVGDTGTSVVAALVAMINADVNNTIVTAGAVGTPFGISLTAIGVGTTFSIALGGALNNATKEEPEGIDATHVGVSTAMAFGDGTYKQLLDLENAYSVERGNTNQIWQPQFYYKVPTNLINTSTYDTYTFAWNGRKKISTGELNTMRFETIVAMPVSATQQANWETIMQTLVGLFESSETGS